MNDCKDCIYIKNLTEAVKDLKTRVKDVNTDINTIRIEHIENKIKLNSFINTLNEIKVDVKDIKKSNQNLVLGIFSGVVIAVITAFLLQGIKIFHW